MIEVVTDLKNAAGLQDEWDELYRRSGTDNVFVTFSWIQNWMNAFADDNHVILLNRAGGRLSSVGVFRCENGTYSFISTEHSVRPEVLASHDSCHLYSPFFDYFESKGSKHRIHLNGSPDNETFLNRLKQEASERYYILRQHPHRFCAIEIPHTMDDYLRTRSKQVRRELARKKRKLHRTLSDVALCAYPAPPAPMDVDDVFQKIRDIERDSWKLENQTAIISSDQVTRYYRGVLGINSSDVKGAAFILENSGIPLAFALGVIHHNRFYVIKTSYKKEFSSLSPGQVLFLQLIAYCCTPSNGIRHIELVGNDTRWIRELSSIDRPFCDVQLIRKSVTSGIFLFAKQQLGPIARRVVKRHPRLAAMGDKLTRRTRRILK